MKKLLNPLIVLPFILVLVLGSVAHLFYGSCQTSKWHYIVQRWHMPKYLPEWALKERYDYYGSIDVHITYTGTWKEWSRDGRIRSRGDYVNGVKEGTHIEWGYSGDWNESKFDNGLLISLEEWGKYSSSITYYDKTGKFIKKDIFENNKLIKIETEAMVDGCRIIFRHSANNGDLVDKEYIGTKGEFLKREYFENNKLIKTQKASPLFNPP